MKSQWQVSGNKGWITDHSKSVRSKRAIKTSMLEDSESQPAA